MLDVDFAIAAIAAILLMLPLIAACYGC